VLKERLVEWETWLERVKKMADTSGVSLDPTVELIAKKNIEILRSYSALQVSVRNYRLHFPQYLDALLRYVEQSNEFFQKQWVEVNADRLERWHTAFTLFLPELQTRLTGIYAAAARYTAQCLVPACRLDAIPVKEGTFPWHIFDKAVFALSGDDRAWLPNAFPLWEGEFDSSGQRRIEGRHTQWHPLVSYGEPIPDLTFDFSQLNLRQPITVPILKVNMHPMRLPFPPSVFTGSDITSLPYRIEELARFTPPTFNLDFPQGVLFPDPETALFTVPEPPTVLPTWRDALTWRENQLAALMSTCDNTGETFLVHEFEIYGTARDPAAVRAVTLVPGIANRGTFGPPTLNWPGSGFRSSASEGLRTTSLMSSLFCTRCVERRPQTTIS